MYNACVVSIPEALAKKSGVFSAFGRDLASFAGGAFQRKDTGGLSLWPRLTGGQAVRRVYAPKL